MKITKRKKNGELVTYEGLVEIIYAETGCSGCLIIILLLLALIGHILK
jgi:hypothetical protein